jgi:hypothetical protein
MAVVMAITEWLKKRVRIDRASDEVEREARRHFIVEATLVGVYQR